MAKLIRHRRDVIPKNLSDDVIVCKVCLTCYDDGPHLPLLLHCRHTYCGLCIADCLTRPEDRSVVLCPLCKVKTGLRRKGLAGLQVNQTSLEAVRKLAKEEEESRPTSSSTKQQPRGEHSSSQGQMAALPLNVAKQEFQLKGILKVRPKQALLNRHEVLRHDLRYSHARNSSQNDKENGVETVSEVDRVIVKSVDHLHPPPQQSNLDSVQASATDHPGDAIIPDEDHSTNAFDISEADFAFPEEEKMTSNPPSAILNSLPPDETPLHFIRRRSAESNDDRPPIVDDIERGPFGVGAGEEELGRGRIYPLTALLSMASAEGVPVDQIASAGLQMTSELSPLTEAQRRLPSNAKYVGRFGNYSANRQPGSLQRPQKMAVSSDGMRLAVVDPQRQGVHVFSSKGEFVHFFVVPNATGAVAFLVDDHLAVTTTVGVQVHLMNGVHRKSIPVGGGGGGGGSSSNSAGVLAVAPLKQGFVAASRNRISVCRSLVSPVVHSINGKRDAQLTRKLIPFEEIVDVAVSSRGELCILEAKVVFVTDEDGLILTSIRPDEASPCGPIGRGLALASCPDDRSIVIVDDGLRRVLLFGPEGQFVSCLLNFNDRFSSDATVNGIAVTKSKRLFLVSTGDKMAEVRAYTF